MAKVIFKKPGAGYGFGCFIGDTTEIKDKATIEKLIAAGVVEVVKAEKATAEK